MRLRGEGLVQVEGRRCCGGEGLQRLTAAGLLPPAMPAKGETEVEDGATNAVARAALGPGRGGGATPGIQSCGSSCRPAYGLIIAALVGLDLVAPLQLPACPCALPGLCAQAGGAPFRLLHERAHARGLQGVVRYATWPVMHMALMDSPSCTSDYGYRFCVQILLSDSADRSCFQILRF